MAFIEEQFRAYASNIAGATDDQNFHPRKVMRGGRLINSKRG
jgi:hypothetical protein